MRDDTGAFEDDDIERSASEREDESESAEARSKGRDVQDRTREGVTHGVDVITDAENPEIEPEGRTVVDRSHRVETHGVDVIDLGPVEGAPDEQPDR